MLVNESVRNTIKRNTNNALTYVVYLKAEDNTVLNFDLEIMYPIIEKQIIASQPIGAVPISTIDFQISGNEAGIVDSKLDWQMYYEIHSIDPLNGDQVVKSKTYVITSIVYDKASNSTKFSGLDLLSKLVTRFEAPQVEYPVRYYEWVQAFFRVNHLVLENESLFQDDHLLLEAPNLDETYSNFDVLKKIAEFSLSCAYMTNKDQVRFIRMSSLIDNVVDDQISQGIKAFESSANQYRSLGVNTLVLGLQSDIDEENVSTMDQNMIDVDGVVEVRINDVPFVSSQADKEMIIEAMFDEIRGFKYISYRLESKYWYFEIGDKISVELKDQPVIKLPVLSVETTHQGSAMTILSATADDVVETVTKWSEFSPRKKTEVKIDKVNQNIKLVNESLEATNEDITELYSSLTLTNSSLQVEIEDRALENNQIRSEISSSIEMLKDEFTLEFSRTTDSVDNLNDSVNTMRTYFTFNENGIVIGKNQSRFAVSISNSDINFLDSGSAIASISGQIMMIDQAQIINSFRVGYHLFEKYNGAYSGTLIRKLEG